MRFWREHNEQLAALRRSRDLEFWYHEFTAAEIAAAERQLIRALNPSTNKVRYLHSHEN